MSQQNGNENENDNLKNETMDATISRLKILNSSLESKELTGKTTSEILHAFMDTIPIYSLIPDAKYIRERVLKIYLIMAYKNIQEDYLKMKTSLHINILHQTIYPLIEKELISKHYNLDKKSNIIADKTENEFLVIEISWDK